MLESRQKNPWELCFTSLKSLTNETFSTNFCKRFCAYRIPGGVRFTREIPLNTDVRSSFGSRLTKSIGDKGIFYIIKFTFTV